MSLYARRLAGIGLLLGIALLIVLGVTKPNPLAHKHSYWAVFDTAHGMGAIDRDVRIAGVRVGEVGKVERIGDNVRVELKLNEDHPLHTDARADMRPHTLLEGSNYVDLAPGSPAAPRLKQGGVIPLAQTTNYVTLDRALRVLRPAIREDLRHLAKVGADTLQGKAISGIQESLKGGPALNEALAPAARAAEGPHRRELVGAIHGFANTVEALDSERAELVPFERRASQTLSALTVDGGAPLDAALVQLPGTLQALNDGAPTLDAVVQRLSAFASKLGTRTPAALARALRATTPILTKASPVLHDGTPLVRGARLIASRLAEAKGGLVTMFQVLASPLKTFPGTLKTLNAPTSLGATSGAFQLVAGAFEGLGGAVSTFQTSAQNPSQPGHQLRGDLYGDLANGGATLLSLLGGGGSNVVPALRATAPPAIPCGQVARISPRAVAPVKANGGCR
jgi:virulence factor Mce-like protein